MCYTVNVKTPLAELVKQMKAAQAPEEYTPPGRVSGFAFPLLPVITEEDPKTIQLFKWGLIPTWAKEDKAAELAKMTLNAREDTIFEKPWNSYRVSVDDIENLTGYDLLANVPDAVEREIEAQSDKVKVSGMYLYSDW